MFRSGGGDECVARDGGLAARVRSRAATAGASRATAIAGRDGAAGLVGPDFWDDGRVVEIYRGRGAGSSPFALGGALAGPARGMRVLRTHRPAGADEGRGEWWGPALIMAQAPPRTSRYGALGREAAEVVSAKPPGKWLILADQQGVGEELAAALHQGGDETVLVFAGEEYAASDEGCQHLNPARKEDFHRLLRAVGEADALPWRGVVHLCSLDAPGGPELTVEALEAAQVHACGSVLHLVQASVQGPSGQLFSLVTPHSSLPSVQGLVEAKAANPPPLWLVTRGAQPAGNEARPLAVAQAPLWGLGRRSEEHTS